jgi:hypothetical protein
MARYLQEEVYNEVSKIFRTRLEPGREGGSLNTQVEYSQLLEVAATTLLFNDNAIYHLARLSSNSLTALVRREVNILEDILVALEDLGQIGAAVVDSATLSNANTALLSLDAAASVRGRPETARFLSLMDSYAGKQRANIVSKTTGSLVRTREEARNVLQTNAERLAKVHNKLLTHVVGLRDMMDEYDAQDVPSRVSTNALRSVRSNLDELRSNETTWSPSENLAASRKSALTAMASKVAVRLMGEFTNPQELKYRSPNRPIPSTLKHLIQTVGTGEAAYADTGSGPWPFPISGQLSVSVNGGSASAVDLDQLAGSVLNGRNPESFVIAAGDQQRIVVVLDRNVYELTTSSGSTTSVTTSEYEDFSFKHLDLPVFFPDMPVATTTDLQPRAITELRTLQSCTMSYTPSTKTALCGSFVAVDEGSTGFQAHHVGCYLKDSSGNRFEIAEVLSSVAAILSVPDVNPAVTPSNGATTLHGQVSTLSDTKVSFLPALSTAPTGAVRMGPCIKLAELPTGTLTAADVIDAVQDENGPGASHVGAALNKHVKVQTVGGDPTRLAFSIRNRRAPYLLVGTTYLDVDLTTPNNPVIVHAEAQDVLGFARGATLESVFDSNDLLSPEELGRAIQDAVSGVDVQELRSTLSSGTTLGTTVGTKLVTDLSAAFQSAGVAVGDVVVIGTGDAAGSYQVASVNSETELEVSRVASFGSSEANLTYSVSRWKLRISSQSRGTNSALLFSGASEFELPSTTQRGSIKTVAAADRLGNLFTFSLAKPGDLLRLVGSRDEYEIEKVDGTTLTLVQGLPSNTSKAGFEIRRGAAKAFESLNSRLTTFTSSSQLLKLNKFDEGVDELTNAIISASLPGQNFASNRVRANRLTMDLLSILTDTLHRTDEYALEQRVGPDNLLDILRSYSATPSVALTSLVKMFTERRYDRAADLLLQGRMSEFFATTEESGSYGGSLMQSSRTALGDLPRTPTTQFSAEREMNSATRVVETLDAEEDFSDTDDFTVSDE